MYYYFIVICIITIDYLLNVVHGFTSIFAYPTSLNSIKTIAINGFYQQC